MVEVDGLTLTVESTDGRRVGKVLVVTPLEDGDDEAEQDGDLSSGHHCAGRRLHRLARLEQRLEAGEDVFPAAFDVVTRRLAACPRGSCAAESSDCRAARAPR